MDKKLLNAGELGEYLSLSRGSIYMMRFEGKIPAECVVRMGRALRFDREAINKWISEMKNATENSSIGQKRV